ncbi:hypothetical protein HBM99_05655 [Providencia heimbachae]|nr:hypothetical protein [Providencia heimbachae]
MAFIPLLVALFFIYQNSKLERANESLNNQLSAQQVINKATLSAVTLFHQISLDNIKAKQVEGSEHVKIKTVIKTVLKDSECAVTDVPANVSSELQQYERNIRERASSSDSRASIN